MRLLHAVVPAVVVAVLLTACGGGGTPSGDGTKTAPPATGGTTATPTPTPAPPSATVLPPDCLTLVSQADASTFTTELNSPVYTDLGPTGVKAPTAPPADATPLQIINALSELDCLWADPNADVSHLRVRVGHVEADVQQAMIATLGGDGYSCVDANGGTQCSITTPNSQFPVDDNFTYLFRDDVVIEVDQTNYPTNNLMGSMVAEVWS